MKHALKPIIGTILLSAFPFAASAQTTGEPETAGKKPSAQSQNTGNDPSARSQTGDKTSSAQSQPPEKIRNPRKSGPGSASAASISAAKGSDLIGMEIVDSQGEKLGSVREIAVDVESGRIVQVILSSGGFLGVGSTDTAVPPGALLRDPEGRQLKLDGGKEQLQGAPSFDSSKWSESFTSERLTGVYKHFGAESSLDFVGGAEGAGNRSSIPESRLDGVQRSSEIVGMKVSNLQNEAIGDVSEILLDLPAGRVLALVVDTGEFLEIEDGLSAIPASSFRLSTDRETLQLDTSKAALQAAPHFKSDRWPDFTREETAGSIFASHSVEPYFASGSATNPRAAAGGDRGADAASPHGEGSTDMATTTAIKKEIRETENISVSARNISVVTKDGQTTLSGSVDSADEKRIIGEIASRNSRKAEVENLLVVKTATKGLE